MNLKNILWVRNTGRIVPNAPIADNLFGMKLSGGGVITTATGNPVSIITNKAQNAISTILSYSPKQSGTGTPSPQNVRPIEGYSEISLNVCGKNLVDVQGATITSQTTVCNHFVLKKGTYTLSIDAKNNNSIRGRFRVVDYATSAYIGGITIEGYADARLSSSFTITEDRSCKIIANGESVGYSFSFDNVQLEVGTTATAYEPYKQGATITESLGGTYYGFTVDLENGAATIDRVMVDLGDLTYTKYTTAQGTLFRTSTISNSNLTYNSTNFICTAYKAVRSGSRTDFTISCAMDNAVDIIDNRFAESTQNEFKTAVTGQKLVYELATPIELPLTPQTVALLKGNNTLWTDGDEITITYKGRG